MIHNALVHIKEVLNENLKNEFSISENKVVLSNLMNPDGSMATGTEDKIVFFLLNLEEESTLKNNLNRMSGGDGVLHRNAAVHLNMQLVFCANFTGKNYVEGLGYLSAVLRFFQSKNQLESKLSSKSSKNNKLKIELCALNYSDLSHVWSAIGSKIMPSAVYKVRLLTMDSSAVSKIIPTINEPNKLS